MWKIISFLLLFLIMNGNLSAQTNRQLKAVEQLIDNYEIIESKIILQKLANKISKTHKKYGQFLYLQAQLYNLEGDYLTAYETIQLASKSFPDKEKYKVYSLQGRIALNLEQFELADSLLKKAITHHQLFSSSNFLVKGEIKMLQGELNIEREDYLKADSFYYAGKKLLEETNLTNTIFYIKILCRLSESKMEQEQFDLSQQFLNQSKHKLNSIFLGEHPEQAYLLVQAGRLAEKIGDTKQAEKAFQEAVRIRSKIYNNNHPLYILAIQKLALSYYNQGKYAKAEELLLEAKKSASISRTSAASFAFTMLSLGTLYENTGKHEQAIEAFTLAKDAYKTLENTSKYSTCINNLAAIYSTINKPTESTALFEEGKLFLEDKKRDSSHIYAAILINLGLNYIDDNQPEKAKPTLEKAKALVLKIFGQDHPYYASVIINLAHLYEKTNQLEKARAFYLETERIDKLVLGEKHPYFMSTLANTANIYALLEKQDTAYVYYQRLIEGQTNLIYNYYSTFEEDTRLSYLKESMDYFEEFHSFVARQDTITPSAYIDMQQISLSTKNLALDFSVDNKVQIDSLQDATTLQLLKEWTALRQQLGQAYTMSEKERAQAGFDLAAMEEIAILLEKQLVRSNEAMSKQLIRQQLVTFEDIQTALKPAEAAIDFIKFQYYLPTHKTDSVFYAALITRKEAVAPQYILLTEEKQLARILKAKIRANGSNYVANPKVGYDLYQLLWQPLQPYLKDVKTIKISPTGLLHKVAFTALSNNTEGTNTLMNQFRFDYYGNLRDLVKQSNQTKVIAKKIALVGGANFDLDSLTLQQLSKKIKPANNPDIDLHLLAGLAEKSTRSGDLDSTRASIRFHYLPGTEQEVKSIEAQLIKQNWQVQTYTKNEALEDNIKALSGQNAPAIIHLATHGYFFVSAKKQQDNSATLKDRISLSNNPLIRSGLVFTGVNHVWQGGGRIPNLDDGVLTAYEISNLDLFNTNLVILSACETGLGDIYDTEGVFGLQRAFKMAGVQQLIISLWKVPDQQTTELMTTFYQFYLQSNNAATALHQAQLAISTKYRPFYWAGFILAK